MNTILNRFSIYSCHILSFLALKTIFAATSLIPTENTPSPGLKNQKTPFIYQENSGNTIIGEHVWILNDKSKELTFNEALVSNYFHKSNSEIPNLGVSSSNFWLLFSIKNKSSSPHLLLELAESTLDKVELYTINQNGKHIENKLGEDQPFNQRKYKDPNYIFDIHIPQNNTQNYLMKIIGSEQVMIPLTLGKPKSIHESIYLKNLISGIFTGIILIMFIYNLFIYFSTKDESYLYYVVYIILLGLTHMTLQGYTHMYIWPSQMWFIKYSVPVLSSLVGIAAMLFVKKFLDTKQYVPILNRAADICIVLFFVCILLSASNKHLISFQLMQLNTTISSLLVLFMGYKVLKRGYRPAKFFMLGWSFLLAGAIVFLLKDFGIIPYNTYTNYSMQFGSIVEVALLSFALADRINILKAEKEEAQARELEAQKDKEDALEKKAEELQDEVNIATLELKLKNQRLETAYRQLELAKSELIQKEKISALMLMAAGTSHEFNNANTTIQLAFDVIDINTKFHKEYIDKLHEILPEAKNIEPQLEDLEDYKEEIKYEFISKDIQDAMRKAQNGLEKLAVNTKKLKDFSKIDNEGWIYADINQDLLDLSDLWNSNLGAIQLKLNLNKYIPRLLCNGQMVNDCFKSILQNAIEAIKEKDIPEKEGLITIATNVFEGSVVISFTDNGIGMSEEISSRAFDFFFTTKGVKKTGTSLTIVKTTLITHNGHVEMDTKINEGTTIRLIIPVKTK